VRDGSDLLVDPVAEGMDRAIARVMDEVDRPTAVLRGFQHGQGRRDADAGGNQHQRLAARTKDEVAGRSEELDAIAYVEFVVQVVGYTATLLTLDADAVFAAIAECRQGVVAAHFLAVEVQTQADVLARG